MNRLTVLYDGRCALCVRCRDFLATSRTLVPLELLSCQSREARERYGAVPWLGEELVVVSDEGDVWAGPAAFLVAMWALADYREWSYRLSGPELAPLAERFFVAISSQRRRIASLFEKPRCEDGDVCSIQHDGASPAHAGARSTHDGASPAHAGARSTHDDADPYDHAPWAAYR